MDCMQYRSWTVGTSCPLGVSIPQAVWIACNWRRLSVRRRLIKVSIPQAVWIACNQSGGKTRAVLESFNTASGMDCMQCSPLPSLRPPLLFQYRKRYGLHAIRSFQNGLLLGDEFQYRKRYGLHAMNHVYFIWISTSRFNTASGMDCMQFTI